MKRSEVQRGREDGGGGGGGAAIFPLRSVRNCQRDALGDKVSVDGERTWLRRLVVLRQIIQQYTVGMSFFWYA